MTIDSMPNSGAAAQVTKVRPPALRLPGGLVCAFPYCDLDGTPHPGCDHQHMTTDPVELAIIRGVAETILAAGLPRPFVRAGEPIRTTWGCEENKRLKARDATITDVTLGLYRDRRSMWYRPAYQYIGQSGSRTRGMFLVHIERRDGAVWTAPHGGSWSPFYFRLEWVSPNHGGIEMACDEPWGDLLSSHAQYTIDDGGDE